MPLKKHPALAALVVVVLLGIGAGVVVIADNNKGSQQTTATSSQTSTTTNAATSSSTSTSTQYKDGTYTKEGSYITPGGQESITVTVTLKDGIVTDSSVQNVANNRDSREYQSAFTSNYKSQVVGKSVGEISLSRVAGSSLTSSGFNDALEQIKNDAKA